MYSLSISRLVFILFAIDFPAVALRSYPAEVPVDNSAEESILTESQIVSVPVVTIPSPPPGIIGKRSVGISEASLMQDDSVNTTTSDSETVSTDASDAVDATVSSTDASDAVDATVASTDASDAVDATVASTDASDATSNLTSYATSDEDSVFMTASTTTQNPASTTTPNPFEMTDFSILTSNLSQWSIDNSSLIKLDPSNIAITDVEQVMAEDPALIEFNKQFGLTFPSYESSDPSVTTLE